MLSGADHLARFAYMAANDTSACLARLNADVLCRLRTVWVDKSHLPSSIKEAVKRDPLPPGVPPLWEHVEFTALIVGDTLSSHYEEAYSRAKSEQVLSKKSTAFKPPKVKRRTQNGSKGAPAAKRRNDGGQQPARGAQQGSQQHQRSGQPSHKGKGKGKGQDKGPSGDKPPKDS